MTIDRYRSKVCSAFTLMGLMFVGAPTHVWSQDDCIADISAQEFLDHAASKSNNFIAIDQDDQGGSCIVFGVSALANASAAADKVCKFKVLSRSLKAGWRLSEIEFHQGRSHSHVDWNGGSQFSVSAEKGESSQVALVTFKVCGPSTNWKDAF